MPNSIRVILFDIGGVLVEPTGVPAMLDWMNQRVSADQLWTMWLASPTVRAFETGRIPPDEFADRLIAEMSLPVTRDQLLAEFPRWTTQLFPGALDLVARIPRRYIRATLCNTNALHWPRLMHDLELAAAFDHHFPSHLTGKIKPDDEAFHHVTETLDCRPDEVLFLDDNQLNVDAATRIGMRADVVKGVSAADRLLQDAGLLARE